VPGTVSVAVPLLTVAVPRLVPSRLNVTVPAVTVPVPPVTVAVSTIDWAVPALNVLVSEASVVVLAYRTVTATPVEVDDAKVAVPLNCAVNVVLPPAHPVVAGVRTAVRVPPLLDTVTSPSETPSRR